MNLQPPKEKDCAYEDSKVFEFDHKYQEFKENIQKPNELKEYEDFDLKCIETSFHQQRTELRRKSSNKKNPDAIQNLASNQTPLIAAASDPPSPPSNPPLQRKRPNIEIDIRPCEPNER